MTKGVYALQKLRIQTGLRLCANFRDKLRDNSGDLGGEDDEELSEKAQKILDVLKAQYRRLTEGVAKRRRALLRNVKVSSARASFDWPAVHANLMCEPHSEQMSEIMFAEAARVPRERKSPRGSPSPPPPGPRGRRECHQPPGGPALRVLGARAHPRLQ